MMSTPTTTTRISVLIVAMIVAGSIILLLISCLVFGSAYDVNNDHQQQRQHQRQLSAFNDPKTVRLRHTWNNNYSDQARAADGSTSVLINSNSTSDSVAGDALLFDKVITPLLPSLLMLAPRPEKMPNLLLPNVLLIGAQKSGSTSVSFMVL